MSVPPYGWAAIRAAFAAELTALGFTVLDFADPAEVPGAQLQADRVLLDLARERFGPHSSNGRVEVTSEVAVCFLWPLRTGSVRESREELAERVRAATRRLLNYDWYRAVAGFNACRVLEVDYGFGADPADGFTFQVAVLSCEVVTEEHLKGAC